MAEVETAECEHCHERHEVVGRVGEVPILHCPQIDPEHAQMIVGDSTVGVRRCPG